VRIRHWLFTSRYSPLTYLFYTPEFHLGHHAYFNNNYALFCPLWDHLFGTYREYQKKDLQMLPEDQQDFVFIGHNGGLGHLLTIPELCFYNIYEQYRRIPFLPLKMEYLLVNGIAFIVRNFFSTFYYCSRYCIANEYIGRIICLVRTPLDYMSPKSYKKVNDEILQLIREQNQKYGTRYFGLGNLNKMKQLNESGIDIVKLIQQDDYLSDKKIRVWTGDTLTVASVFRQIADIPELDSLYYIGAGGKVGTAVCQLLVRERPNLKIRIFSRHKVLDHLPNISYSTDLSEIRNYRVALIGKILSPAMYNDAFQGGPCKTRFLLDYTVPAIPIEAAKLRPEKIQYIRVGLLKTYASNPTLKGHFDVSMSHDENHIVPCHFGCILNTINRRETNEVGEIDLDNVEKMWKMTVARGFGNITFDYTSYD